jgi:hypothetical protein
MSFAISDEPVIAPGSEKCVFDAELLRYDAKC